MTVRNLDTRIGRLEAARPASDDTLIDLSKLTEEQLAMCERIPRLPNGQIDYHAMSDHDLRLMASIAV